MATPTSRCLEMAYTEYSFHQVRTGIATMASLNNLYSYTWPSPSHHDTFGSLVDRIEIIRGTLAGKRPAGRNQRNVQGSRGRAGAYSRNLSLAWSSRSNRPGRRSDGDGSVLCLAPFFSSSPWGMKMLKSSFYQTDYSSIFRHEHDRLET